jgi:UDP-2-acetamido-2-deoxy-ribo-hexuluronate aminotransferase
MELRGIQAAHAALAQEIEAAVRRVFAHGRFIAGPEVAEFEAALGAYTGVAHCLSCGNGTDALCLIMAALDIGPGDAVFLPGYTFFATAEAVMQAGAAPVLVDVRACDGNIDPTALSSAIEHCTAGRPRAVIGVDLFGRAADWPALEQIAARHGLLLIEDAAQSVGGWLEGRACGSFGRAAAVSFFPSKPLGGVGDGGAVLTNDSELAQKVALLKNHGRQGGPYRHIAVGGNSRLDSLQAAVLMTKLAHLAAWIEACDHAAARYAALLPGWITPLRGCGVTNSRSAWAQYMVALPHEEARLAAEAALRARDIPYARYYPLPLHRQPVLAHLEAELPVCDRLSQTTLALPMHPFITTEQQAEVTQALWAAGRP